MDKDKVLEYCIKYKKGTLNIEEASNWILAYCLENNKEEQLSKTFTTLILGMGLDVMCLSHMYNYYKDKYQFKELYTPNINGVQVLIHIY